MKQYTLIVGLLLLILSSPARADVIGIFSDDTGASCTLAPGFSSTTAIIHKFTTGAIRSHFKMELSQSPGTVFLFFNTSLAATGTLTSDITLDYGQCVTGSLVLGHVIADWAAGDVAIRSPDSVYGIFVTDCSGRQFFAVGQRARVGVTCNNPIATEPSTWGSVKALYR